MLAHPGGIDDVLDAFLFLVGFGKLMLQATTGDWLRRSDPFSPIDSR